MVAFTMLRCPQSNTEAVLQLLIGGPIIWLVFMPAIIIITLWEKGKASKQKNL